MGLARPLTMASLEVTATVLSSATEFRLVLSLGSWRVTIAWREDQPVITRPTSQFSSRVNLNI